MKNETILIVRGSMQDGEHILGTYTANPAVAMKEFLDYANAETATVRIENVNTGELYADYNCERDEWGIQINRSVSHEFVDMLLYANLQKQPII